MRVAAWFPVHAGRAVRLRAWRVGDFLNHSLAAVALGFASPSRAKSRPGPKRRRCPGHPVELSSLGAVAHCAAFLSSKFPAGATFDRYTRLAGLQPERLQRSEGGSVLLPPCNAAAHARIASGNSAYGFLPITFRYQYLIINSWKL